MRNNPLHFGGDRDPESEILKGLFIYFAKILDGRLGYLSAFSLLLLLLLLLLLSPTSPTSSSSSSSSHFILFYLIEKENKKAQLSLTNTRDACEKFARFT